ncbi:MAG: hypothetical protein R2744_02565 [Bacteroidales bacterium]
MKINAVRSLAVIFMAFLTTDFCTAGPPAGGMRVTRPLKKNAKRQVETMKLRLISWMPRKRQR